MSYRQHSSYLFLFILMAGISFLFISLLGALTYLYFQSDVGNINFPLWFLITSTFILMTSFFAEKSKVNFKESNSGLFEKAWSFTLLSVFLFFTGQLVSWNSIWSQEVFMSTSNSYAFTYLLSGLHLLHVLAAIPFLVWIYFQFQINKNEEYRLQLFFSDQLRYRQINQAAIYLHFMGGLWFLLLLVFSLMSII